MTDARQSGASGVLVSDVDSAADPDRHIRYLDAAREDEEIQARSKITQALLRLREGDVVLDAGCGAGDEAIAIADIIGHTGRVVGIDASRAMVDEATQRASDRGANVEFRVGDLCALEFPDNSFDASHTERVLIHVESPVRAIQELIRVTRPGGRIAVCEPDFGTVAVDAQDAALRNKIHDWVVTKGVRNAWMGRQLRRLFMSEGLLDVSIEARAAMRLPPVPEYFVTQAKQFVDGAKRDKYVTQSEAEKYVEWLDQAVADGTYLTAMIVFIVAGTVPDKQ